MINSACPPFDVRRCSSFNWRAPRRCALGAASEPGACPAGFGPHDFVEPIQSDLGRPVPRSKIFWFPADPNHFYIRRRPASLEGRIAIVTNARRDAVDAAASGVQMGSQGGLLPVSDDPARGRTAIVADGEVVWSWHPLLVSSRRSFGRPDRAQTKTYSPTTVARGIRAPGRARSNR
jgi:hypothetical protein